MLLAQVNLLIPLHLKDNKTQSLKWRIDLKKSIRPTNQSQNTSVEPAQPQSEYLSPPSHPVSRVGLSAVPATAQKQKVQLS